MAASEPLHVTFVCTGNICRSPMAEKILLAHLDSEGLADRVRVSSAGTEGFHTGSEADERTNVVLRAGRISDGPQCRAGQCRSSRGRSGRRPRHRP